MTSVQAALSIVVMALITLLTRALPFLLFDRGKTPPKVILYLGRVLPPAVIAMLIVYCLRSLSFSLSLDMADLALWAPQVIAVAAVVALHLWRRNNLLSIFGGTVLFMVLVQTVFV